MDITTVEQLEELYGTPQPGPLRKEVARLTPEYQAVIEASPFFALATAGPEGLDCSPRGDAAGFVRVVGPGTLQFPDRRGNNRLDSLRNIVRDPRVALLFLIPGIGETLRVNGTARLIRDPQLAARFEVRGTLPALVIEVAVGSVYYQCPKAVVRSRLWDPDRFVGHDAVPTAGQIMAGITDEVDAQAFDAAYPGRMQATLY
ncbi:MAG TPA: pyridoxamine 5'-phosphate oxidase family protein [Kineosporiaceae bacterium]|nr:pyridoxamine 5'-phosphate oxidase family protein [Kineosporiaceae bacterium]